MDYISSKESTRRIHKSLDSNFKTTERYVNFKLEMLRNEMHIEPTDKEVAHLRELKTMGDIDRAVHSIIERYWDET